MKGLPVLRAQTSGGPCALFSRSGVEDRANVDGMKVAIFWRLSNRQLVGREYWFPHRLPGRKWDCPAGVELVPSSVLA